MFQFWRVVYVHQLWYFKVYFKKKNIRFLLPEIPTLFFLLTLLMSPSWDVHIYNLFEALADFQWVEFCSFSDPINRQGLKWISKLLHEGGQTSCTQIFKKNYLWVSKFILKWNHHILHWLWLWKNNSSSFSDSCQPNYSWKWILFYEHSNDSCRVCSTVGND